MTMTINLSNNFYRQTCVALILTGGTAFLGFMMGWYLGGKSAYEYADDNGCASEFNYWTNYAPTFTAEEACGNQADCCDTANDLWGKSTMHGAGLGALAGAGCFLLFKGAAYLKSRFSPNEAQTDDQSRDYQTLSSNSI